jgi:hypothetical protein
MVLPRSSSSAEPVAAATGTTRLDRRAKDALSELWMQLVELTANAGYGKRRKRCSLFMALPPRSELPEYYDIIQEPIELNRIYAKVCFCPCLFLLPPLYACRVSVCTCARPPCRCKRPLTRTSIASRLTSASWSPMQSISTSRGLPCTTMPSSLARPSRKSTVFCASV